MRRTTGPGSRARLRAAVAVLAGLAICAACSSSTAGRGRLTLPTGPTTASSAAASPTPTVLSPPPSAAGPTTGSASPSAPPTTSRATPTTSAGPSAPPTGATSTAPSGRAGFVAPPLAWRPCESDAQCAMLTVPVDYSTPRGATLRLALIRRPATDPAHRIGSLVTNPGGPGASGYDFVRDSSTVFTPQLRSRFDIVGFDPRGVARSRGVDCTTDAQLDAFLHDDPVPDSAASRRTYTADSRAFAARCARSAGSLLAHVGTVEAARDLDVLRAALGEAKLTWFGYSYGTYLGATYAEMFPTRVRAAVLDGAVDPSLDLVGFVQGQARAFDAALQRWFAWCTPTHACPLAARGARTPAQRFDALAASARAAPLRVGTRSLGPGELSYGVSYTLYSPSLWPALGGALAAAERGDGEELLALSDQYTSRSDGGHYDDSLDANYAVNCLDHAGPTDEQGWYDAASAVRAAAPRLGEAIVYTTLPCAYWPVPARAPLPVDAAGGPPIVVVGTTHDPATPYAWAQSLARQLARGVLLTFDGDGHTAYGPQSACVQRQVDRYLLDLVPPAPGTRC